MLLLIATMGLALTVASEVWQTAQRRDKEEDLLFVGNQFRRAVAMYVANTGSYPRRLEDLLKDPGFPGMRRYLRKIYRDPMTGRAEWGVMMALGNSIAGVYSLSDERPLKQSGFGLADQDFEGKKKYSEWVFLAQAAQALPAGDAAAAQGPRGFTMSPGTQGSDSPVPAAPAMSGKTDVNAGPSRPDTMVLRARK